uniref:ATP synthase F0 subunit 8 n=1 Tax=Sillago panhwari TaxID=2755185 RepID=UPI001E76FE79|nr:ATP synthase F0 subunit 8 [Sillago panhwari]UDL71945.1 ATP synthase F0 subunit 8 [Sillago panhwari]
MPQLDPNPWFSLLIFTWIIFLIFLPPKVMAHTFPNDPAPQSAKKAKSDPWAWPWH